MQRLFLTACVSTLCLVTVQTDAIAQEPIAVAVHPDSPLTDLSLEALTRLYRGHTTLLPSGVQVVLIEHEDVRERFYRDVLNVPLSRVAREWIALVFSGDRAIPPKRVSETARLMRMLRETPGALAILPASELDPSVNVVCIDGLSLEDPDYVLR